MYREFLLGNSPNIGLWCWCVVDNLCHVPLAWWPIFSVIPSSPALGWFASLGSWLKPQSYKIGSSVGYAWLCRSARGLIFLRLRNWALDPIVLCSRSVSATVFVPLTVNINDIALLDVARYICRVSPGKGRIMIVADVRLLSNVADLYQPPLSIWMGFCQHNPLGCGSVRGPFQLTWRWICRVSLTFRWSPEPPLGCGEFLESRNSWILVWFSMIPALVIR